MYQSLYYFLRTYIPIVLHRPFLFSSIYPMILGPLFALIERVRPDWFVKREGLNKELDRAHFYHLFTFICLCLCSVVDPYTFSISLRTLPQDPPPLLQFISQTSFLIIMYEVELSLLHILFHWSKWLYSHVHYIHHLDTDPTVFSTTKLHLQEVLMVFLVMYIIPVCFFNPHPYCLLTSFMVTSVLGILAHCGIKGWYLSEYHRLHHKDPRHNLWNPILSHFDVGANTNF